MSVKEKGTTVIKTFEEAGRLLAEQIRRLQLERQEVERMQARIARHNEATMELIHRQNWLRANTRSS